MDFKKILFKTSSVDVEKALPDGVIFCTKDGKIEWVNDKVAEIFETSKMNLKTSNISAFIENALNLISNALVYDKAVIAKLVDREVYFDMTVKETEEGYALDFRDININESAEDILEEPVNRNKNDFLVKLANDFKSPLQSIIGFSQAMADGLGGNMTDQQEKYIRIIKKNSSDLISYGANSALLNRMNAFLEFLEFCPNNAPKWISDFKNYLETGEMNEDCSKCFEDSLINGKCKECKF